MALNTKARSKNINLIILPLDSWPQAGGRNTDTEGEYQMWKKRVFGWDTQDQSTSPRQINRQERVTIMVWWRARATVGEPMVRIVANLSSGMPVNY